MTAPAESRTAVLLRQAQKEPDPTPPETREIDAEILEAGRAFGLVEMDRLTPPDPHRWDALMETPCARMITKRNEDNHPEPSWLDRRLFEALLIALGFGGAALIFIALLG